MEVLIGRLHPLLVHLPIGFILLIFVVETLGMIRRPWRVSKQLLCTGYLVACLASIVTLSTGLILAGTGRYFPDLLQTHQWLAISASVLTLVVAFVKRSDIPVRLSYLASGLLVLLISLAGHYGGMLTHGRDYLREGVPTWLSGILGAPAEQWWDRVDTENPDSIVIYRDIVHPILESRCAGCHQARHPMGGFDATQYAALFEEGDEGKPVVPANLKGSELLHRVTLPAEDPKFMPPAGHPLSYGEIAILAYWIEQGADSLSGFDFSTMSGSLVHVLMRDYHLDLTPRPVFERLQVDPLEPAMLSGLQQQGFDARYLGEENYLLDVRCARDTVTSAMLYALQEVGDHLAFLDLSGTWITDLSAIRLQAYPHLIRLDLHQSNISDLIFTEFDLLTYLEVLNIVQTQVTETGLLHALEAPALQRVYVWQSAVTEEALERAKAGHPAVTLIPGFSFSEVSYPDSLNVSVE